jgi:hypothetical protein
VGVDVRAFGDWSHGVAHGPAIFYYLLALVQGAHGDFVAERNIMQQFHRAHCLAFQRDGAYLASLLQISNGNANIVARFVHKNAMLHK